MPYRRKKLTFAISSPDEFLWLKDNHTHTHYLPVIWVSWMDVVLIFFLPVLWKRCWYWCRFPTGRWSSCSPINDIKAQKITHLIFFLFTLSLRDQAPSWLTLTRKHRQSYWHADLCRQQQHTAVAAGITSNRATVMVFVTMWPCSLTFWPLGQCMPSDCYRVYVYKVWCW